MKDCIAKRLITNSEIKKVKMGMISLKVFENICKRRDEADVDVDVDVDRIKNYIISLGLGVEIDEKSLFIPSLVQDFREVMILHQLVLFS